ncbi:MAG: tetratricopeptide repeat protein [Planctomycetota bacterium]
MTRTRSRPVALFLSLVPGWGHIYWGREMLGLGLFTIVAVFGFVLMNGMWIYRGAGAGFMTWISVAVCLATVVGSWIDLVLRTTPARVEREKSARERFLEQGTIAYTRGDFDSAEVDFRECLRIDPQDLEALFRLGVVLARKEDRVGAAKVFEQALRFDLEGKWRWEIARELDESGASDSAPEANESEAAGPKEQSDSSDDENVARTEEEEETEATTSA